MIHVLQARDLTRTTSSIGTTNAHMAPLSPAPTAIQQLHEWCQLYIGFIITRILLEAYMFTINTRPYFQLQEKSVWERGYEGGC